MSKCKNCGVVIAEPAQICPLCRCVLSRDGGEEPESVYPYLHAEKGIKKMQRALRIYIVSAIAAMVLLCLADFRVRGSIGRVILIGAFLAYGYLTLKVSVQMHTGYRLVAFLQAVAGVAVLILIDLVSGFSGWSLTYVIPAACMMADIAIAVTMIVNIRDWQSYIPFQLMCIAFSVLPFILSAFGFVTRMTVPLIGMLVAVFEFAATMIVGGRRAREELYRRFHL